MSVKVSPSTDIGNAVSDVVCAIVSTCAVSIVPALPLELELPELLLELPELLELLPLLDPLELLELLLELLEFDTTSDEWWPQPVSRATANAVAPNSTI